MSAFEIPSPSGEDRLLREALARYREAGGGDVRVGPGHDTAAFDVDGATTVVTTDVLVEGVHFRWDSATPELVARKALAVNVSDLAAAAAVPVGFVVGGVFPRPADPELFGALAEGFAKAAQEMQCPCIGGDTNTVEGPLVLAVTAFGRTGPMGVLTRAGATPGMQLSVTGALGGSLLGRHLRFTPRVSEAQALAQHAVPAAMMDLSDGLAKDLPRLCRASGVGAVVRADAVPCHDDAHASAATSGRTPLDHALGDGEDFELLVAHAPLEASVVGALAEHGVTLHAIGEIVPAEEGLRLVQDGTPRAWPAGGYDHVGDYHAPHG